VGLRVSPPHPGPPDPLQAALRQCRTGLFYLIAFGFVINGLFLVAPLYMLQVFDRVLASQRVETLLLLTVIAGFALLIMGLLETVRGRIQTRMSVWLDKTLSGPLIAASVGTALAGHYANAQALRDLGTVRSFVSSGLKALLDLPWSPLFIVVLWLLHPSLGWFAAGFAVVLMALAVVNELVARKPAQEANAERVVNENLVEQAIRNADVLQAMGIMPRFLSNWHDRHAGVVRRDLFAGDCHAIMVGATRFVRMLAQVGVLGLGAYFVIHGELTAGGMVAGSILLGRALAPIEQVIGAWRGMLAARAARSRLKRLFATTEVRDRPLQLPAPKGVLVCDGVWYAPSQGGAPILKNIAFRLEPGEVLALMGPSASGKTTLCRTLVGSWLPTKGFVRLDGAQIDRFTAGDQGRHVGYLPQDVELFAATVSENIARLAPNPDPALVVAAAEVADVHEMILSLPQGYDTLLGRDGTMLSGGQRQRIGLARALFDRPRLIVLDEPNSNLDSAGEAALVAAIEAAKMWSSTIVLVTHGTRVLRPVDRIMVLKDGQQRMLGPRDEVLQALRPGPVLIGKSNQDKAIGGSPHTVLGAVP